MFDVLIIGGVSGISCALGSAKIKNFAADKEVGVFTHQKSSSLQEAVFNNANSCMQDIGFGSAKHQTLSQLYLILLKYQRKNLAD
jgi:hypothetical protein